MDYGRLFLFIYANKAHMITATCTNNDCTANGIGYNFLGDPSRVECGACQNNCQLTDQRDDPPQSEEPAE
jgi:hypothetical protein